MPVFFDVPVLRASKGISFLVDTGSTFSAITEKEATLAGIDCFSLPEFPKESIGFGGLFRQKVINHPVHLRFGSDNIIHTINYDSGFRVTCIPPGASPKDREIMLRRTPCILGMDILSKFKLYLDKKKLELTLVQSK